MKRLSPESHDEFEEALDTLIQRAYQNGVTVADGGYDLRHSNPEVPDWEVLIVRLSGSLSN